jgi:hypothetical protein
VTEQDLILLNSYLDGQLSTGERDALEARLALEAELKAELDSLRETVSLLKMSERVRVPRNFTLDPAKYAQPARRKSWLDALAHNSPLIVVGSMVLFALVFIGGAMAIISPSGSAGTVAMESAPAASNKAPGEGESIEFAAPAEEAATEAPALSGETGLVAPTEAAAGGPQVSVITQEPLPTLDPGTRSGGGGGGPGGSGGAGAVPPVAPAPTGQDASSAGVADTAADAAGQDGGEMLSYTATEEQAGEVVPADVQEADPFGMLNPTGLTIAISIGLIAVVATMILVLVRRRRS